ncbi:MAG: ParB/RepB/Spo0J family partition protein [Dehalococcoidia bacterium]
MTEVKRGLGRGLDALFGSPAAAAPPTDAPPAAATAVIATVPPPAPPPVPLARRGIAEELDIDLIAPNPEQPRKNFEAEQLRDLADSIRAHGVIQPVVVSRDDAGGYRLVAGERRLQAARLAGLETVPVIFREAEDSELLELALIENIQRADLNAIEEAMAYRRLTEEYGLTQEEVARRVGKNRVTVANALRLLALEPEIRRSLVGGEITEGHARALLGLPESRARLNAWREVVKRKLTVRDTEALVRRFLAEQAAGVERATTGSAVTRASSAYGEIEGALRRALSTRVSIVPAKKGAKITIECFSAEEFDHVVKTLLRDQGPSEADLEDEDEEDGE